MECDADGQEGRGQGGPASRLQQLQPEVARGLSQTPRARLPPGSMPQKPVSRKEASAEPARMQGQARG